MLFQPRGYVHPAGVNLPPPTITAGSGTRQSGCAHWESNRTLARFSVVHVTAAIVGKDAKVGQQSVNAVLEEALHARAARQPIALTISL